MSEETNQISEAELEEAVREEEIEVPTPSDKYHAIGNYQFIIPIQNDMDERIDGMNEDEINHLLQIIQENVNYVLMGLFGEEAILNSQIDLIQSFTDDTSNDTQE